MQEVQRLSLEEEEIRLSHRMVKRVAKGYYEVAGNPVSNFLARRVARQALHAFETREEGASRDLEFPPFVITDSRTISVLAKATPLEHDDTSRRWHPAGMQHEIARAETLGVIATLANRLGQEVPELQPPSSAVVGHAEPSRN